jgi:hypothetical protein
MLDQIFKTQPSMSNDNLNFRSQKHLIKIKCDAEAQYSTAVHCFD